MKKGRFAGYTQTNFMPDVFFLEAQHIPELHVCKQVASNLENYADTSVSWDLRPKSFTDP